MLILPFPFFGRSGVRWIGVTNGSGCVGCSGESVCRDVRCRDGLSCGTGS